MTKYRHGKPYDAELDQFAVVIPVECCGRLKVINSTPFHLTSQSTVVLLCEGCNEQITVTALFRRQQQQRVIPAAFREAV